MEAFDVTTLADPARLAALRRTALLDGTADRAFDRLTRLASTTLGVPIALVSLVGSDRQRFRSCVGLSDELTADPQTPLSHSFCKHVVASNEPLVVEDARTDPRLMGNLAIEDIQVIAYAGWPLRTSDGHVLGSFCAIDTAPRAWSATDLRVIEDLAGAALEVIELRTATIVGEARAEQAASMAEVGHRLQEALVPRVPRLRGAVAHAVYQPGERRLLVGGDFLHIAELEDGTVSVLVGDVAGHGAEAAAFAAGLRAAWSALLLAEPDVAVRMARLNAVAIEQQPGEAVFATAVACAVSPDGRTVRTCSAGHPAPIVIGGGGMGLDVAPGPPLGVRGKADWPVREHPLPARSSILVFTDGLVEGRIAPTSSERFGVDRLVGLVEKLRATGLHDGTLLEAVVDVVLHTNGGPMADDLAAVIVRPVPVPG